MVFDFGDSVATVVQSSMKKDLLERVGFGIVVVRLQEVKVSKLWLSIDRQSEPLIRPYRILMLGLASKGR